MLKDIKEEGLEKIHQRTNRLARATRAAGEALGLGPIAPNAPADSSTGLFIPVGVDGGKLVKCLRDEFGVTMAGGQDNWKGKIIRIAHLGYIDTFDTIVAISALEMALRKFGCAVELGKGVGAAQKILLEAYTEEKK